MKNCRLMLPYHRAILLCYYVLLLISTAVEIGSNTPPKYRCGYCIVNNFDRLPVDEIVSIFSHNWVFCVPFLEIDVNVAIEYLMCIVIDIVIVVDDTFRVDRWRLRCSFPLWKSEFPWFDDDFVYLTQSGFLDDGGQLMVSDFS